MNFKRSALLMVLLAVFSGQLKAADLTLRWDQLARMVTGREIELHLSDGTRLKGEALAVRPDSFVMDVENTSNKGRYAKGQTEVPRREVSSVNVIQRTIRWRAITTPAAVIGGAALNGALINVHREGLPLIILPAAIAAGYFLGKRADTHVTKIAIIRD